MANNNKDQGKVPESDQIQMYTIYFGGIKVQIMCENKAYSTFVEALKTIIECKKNGNKEYTVISNHDEEEAKARLVVICPTLFRLKSELDHVIASVKRHNEYAVVICHKVKKDDLPMVPSQEKLEGYDNITIIDMGFHTKMPLLLGQRDKIYKCKKNDEAKQQLFRYLDNFKGPSDTKPDDDPENQEDQLQDLPCNDCFCM